MPREKSWVWEHFHQGKNKTNAAHWEARCNFCIKKHLADVQREEEKAVIDGNLPEVRSKAILLTEARSRTRVTTGKVVVMINHLLSCDYCPADVREKAKKQKGGSESETETLAATVNSNGKRAISRRTDSRPKKQQKFTVVSAPVHIFNSEKQTQFEAQLLRAFVSAGWSFNSLSDPEVQILFRDFSPGATLPTRQRLSNQILTREVVKLEGSIQNKLKGELATLQCDGWKDVAKNHLVAFMYTAQREAHLTQVHNTSAHRKTGENMSKLMIAEIEHLKSIGLVPIGIAGDAGGDERKGRLLTLALMPWLLMAECWGHQIALMLADYYKANPHIAKIMDEAVEVVKWFNNHSYALGVLNKEQQDMYNKAWALILPVISRWTAHFCSLARLLTVWKALRITSIKHEDEILETVGKKPKQKEKAQKILHRVTQERWWDKLVIIKAHLEPLAIAANVAQGCNTRCDQIVLLLANLHRVYTEIRRKDRTNPAASHEDEDHPVTSILNSLEKRFAQADQDLFLTAFVLNPYIPMSLRNSSTLTLAVIIGILRRLYMRVFRVEKPPPELSGQIFDYHHRRKAFSADAWPIDDLKDGLKSPDGTIDPILIWKTLDTKMPLVKLAIHVLSFVPNSTSTERLFSQMGDIKTKKRNCLGVKKTRDCAFVKAELRRRHARDGTARHRLKRYFGNRETGAGADVHTAEDNGSRVEDEELVKEVERSARNDSEGEDSGDADSDEDDGDAWGAEPDDQTSHSPNDSRPRSFESIARRLEEQLDEANDPNIGEDLEIEHRPSGVPAVRVFFGQKRIYSIEDLFDWTVQMGWDEFWIQGVKNYREEMVFYELLTKLEAGVPASDGPPASKDAGEDSDASIEILDDE